MALRKTNNEVTEKLSKKEIIDIKNKCFFCETEAVHIGAFKNDWFNLTVLMCDEHLKQLIDTNVKLASQEYELPVFNEETDNEITESQQ